MRLQEAGVDLIPIILERSPEVARVIENERPGTEGMEGYLAKLLPRVFPRNTSEGPRDRQIEVTDHALREFKKKFPRYAGKLEEGELLEDLKLFVAGSCLDFSRDGRDALLYHVPIWDKMQLITRPLGVSHTQVITMSRRRRDSDSEGSRRAAYGIVLAQRLLEMSWEEMTRKLHRFEHSGGKQGWGMILKRKDEVRVLGTYLTAHELLDFWSYRNYQGETLLGRRLAHIAKRLELPEIRNQTGTLEELRSGFANHGLWADRPSPDALNLEMMNALLRRLETGGEKEGA